MAKLISQTFLDITVKLQHGFCKRRSSLTNLVVNCNFISTSLKSNKQIPFTSILVKLSNLLTITDWIYGVRGSLFFWIQSYLTNRVFSIKRLKQCCLPSGCKGGAIYISHRVNVCAIAENLEHRSTFPKTRNH